MVIDSHLHIGLNGWTEDVLIRYLDQHKIDKAWILTWDEQAPVAPIYYTPLDINVVKRAYKRFPDRIVPFYAPDPGRHDWLEKFSACLNEGFSGFGELKVSYTWDHPVMRPLLEYLDSNKLPIVFHMERARKIFIPKKEKGADWLFKRLVNERFNGRSARLIQSFQDSTGLFNAYLSNRLVDFPGYLLDFYQLEQAVSIYTNIRFIAHGPHVWNNFSVPKKTYLFHQEGRLNGPGLLWDLLDKYDNFFCDLSGYSGFNALKRDPVTSKVFLRKFYTKLLFGTDNMDLGLLDLLKELEPEQDHLDHVLFKNAHRIIPVQ